MKKRADGRYCKQIFVGYHPDGRRKMKTIYGKTLKEVEKKERDIRNDIEKGIFVENDKMTVGQWADEWLKIYKKNTAFNTYNRYKSIINNQIKPHFGDFLLSKLTLVYAQKVVNDLYDRYSMSTLNKIKIVLNQMYKTAIQSNLAYINPVRDLRIHPKERIEKEPISREHIQLLNEFCQSYIHGDLIMTLLYTGVRRGEIFAITWEDIDLNKNIISINKALDYIKNRPHIKEPKTKSSIRKIPILSVLKPYLKPPKEYKLSDPVFKNPKGEMYSQAGVQRLLKNFLNNYNVFLMKKQKEKYKEVHFTYHQFRHTYASILYYAGIDIKTAQSYLGHSSYAVTADIYTHLDFEHKEINAVRLDSFVKNNQRTKN